MTKLKLTGFNNLSKSLALSIYKINFVDGSDSIEKYQRSIETKYSAEQLKSNMEIYTAKIGGSILHTSSQNYQPQGASVNMMIAEGEAQALELSGTTSVTAHLDKSHLCIHTYPEEHFYDNYAIFRADIEVSTCGVITPLGLVSYLFEDYNPDIVYADYRVRGLNRIRNSTNQYLDHEVYSISEYLTEEQLAIYTNNDSNIPLSNLFHSKFMRNAVNSESYEFLLDDVQLSTKEKLNQKALDITKTIYNQA